MVLDGSKSITPCWLWLVLLRFKVIPGGSRGSGGLMVLVMAPASSGLFEVVLDGSIDIKAE